MKSLNVLGLNSGTSMDGIDAAVFKITPLAELKNGGPPKLSTELLYSTLIPFEESFRKNLTELVNSGRADLKEICLLNAALGKVFARAAEQVIASCAEQKIEVDLIGSHGQTIWHEPAATELWGVETRGTLQLGDGSEIATLTKIPVVCDFRTNDVALGGQGAPLVSFADEVLFGNSGGALGILNIGGIANLTVLDSSGRARYAYDSGPGHMVIDRFCQVFFNQEYDDAGKIAASGNIDKSWLAELMQNPYFSRPLPKTTGREDFGYKYADKLIEDAREKGIAKEDAVATVTALTAKSIADSYNLYIRNEFAIEELVVGGGGGQNSTMLGFIKEYWDGPVSIKLHEDYGISTKFKEALLFALLAYTTYFQVPNNVPVCTGAARRVCLGKLIRG
ncbi:MAG: anhydro-N-acetylmuramic acid kinase [Cyanobacteriota/Melainabacteria group bacterium]